MHQVMRLMLLGYCDEVLCLCLLYEFISLMESVWHNYTIYLQIFPHHQCSLAMHFVDVLQPLSWSQHWG
jgi:hypothetical protein